MSGVRRLPIYEDDEPRPTPEKPLAMLAAEVLNLPASMSWVCGRCACRGVVRHKTHDSAAEVTRLVMFDHHLRAPGCPWDDTRVRVRRVI